MAQPVRTRSIAIHLIMPLKRITLVLSACATNAFLYASLSALIDAIPLYVLSKLRHFLWLGSPQKWNGLVVLSQRRSQAMNEMKLKREPFKPTPKKRPLLAILGTAASVHPWTSLLESFGDRAIHLHSSIDAIPLFVLLKLRNFLWLGSPGLGRR